MHIFIMSWDKILKAYLNTTDNRFLAVGCHIIGSSAEISIDCNVPSNYAYIYHVLTQNKSKIEKKRICIIFVSIDITDH